MATGDDPTEELHPVVMDTASGSCEVSNTTDEANDPIGAIVIKMIDHLQIQNNEKKDEIVRGLLKNGRQSVSNYREEISQDLYTSSMADTASELLQLLKQYFELYWNIRYASKHEWFRIFLEQYQHGDNRELYDNVLTRTAEYGEMYMNDDPILSIVLQLLFEGMDDSCFTENHVFNDLWLAITCGGLKAMQKYAEYIPEDVMSEQLNNKNSPLFQALREHFRTQLLCMLKQSSIIDRQNLYEVALDNVTEHGWIRGVQAIQKRCTPKSYEKLLKNIQTSQQLQDQQAMDVDATLPTNETCISVNNEAEKSWDEMNQPGNMLFHSVDVYLWPSKVILNERTFSAILAFSSFVLQEKNVMLF